MTHRSIVDVVSMKCTWHHSFPEGIHPLIFDLSPLCGIATLHFTMYVSSQRRDQTHSMLHIDRADRSFYRILVEVATTMQVTMEAFMDGISVYNLAQVRTAACTLCVCDKPKKTSPSPFHFLSVGIPAERRKIRKGLGCLGISGKRVLVCTCVEIHMAGSLQGHAATYSSAAHDINDTSAPFARIKMKPSSDRKRRSSECSGSQSALI